MAEEKMKRFILFAFLAVAFIGAASGSSDSLRDRITKPEFGPSGELIYIHRNQENVFSLETLIDQSLPLRSATLNLGDIAFSPLVKFDQNGTLWLAWEEQQDDRSSLHLAQVDGEKVSEEEILSDAQGFNFALDLAFDEAGFPWAAWVNWIEDTYRVLVKEVSTGRTWVVNYPFLSAAASPKIAFSGGKPWVFWSGLSDGEEEIFCRTFNGMTWSSLKRINRENDFPQITPEVAGGSGNIWVFWSGYDGQDYEIYGSCWNGTSWSIAKKVTNNDCDDAFPSACLGPDSLPVIAWSQTTEKGNQILLRFFENGLWSKEFAISPLEKAQAIPKIAAFGERIGMTWKSQGEVKANVSYRNELIAKQARSLLPNCVGLKECFPLDLVPPPPIWNSDLKENQYIGFGDSITYGTINHIEVPEKGYIPRLQNMLSQVFGPTQVINEGWPGELTGQGLSRLEGVLSKDLARYFLFLEGTNDVIFNEVSTDTSAFNIQEITKKCLDFGVFPALATILPRRDWVWSSNMFRNRLLNLNKRIRKIAGDRAVPLVELYDAFNDYPDDDGGLLSLLSEDLKHPSEKGYEFMAEQWADAIRQFPFPPVAIRVKREYDKLLFYQKPGNLVTWKESPKIIDKNLVQGYRIYRKQLEKDRALFEFLAVVPNTSSYFDPEINLSDNYAYIVSTLRTDDVEGPCSEQGQIK
jgi:lysophospholipase L1-like esterase